MTFFTNQNVKTPVGQGVVQAPNMEGKVLVRVVVSGSEKDTRCVTPKAVKSSLWLFEAGELNT